MLAFRHRASQDACLASWAVHLYAPRRFTARRVWHLQPRQRQRAKTSLLLLLILFGEFGDRQKVRNP
jgi:hypothetical protein